MQIIFTLIVFPATCALYLQTYRHVTITVEVLHVFVVLQIGETWLFGTEVQEQVWQPWGVGGWQGRHVEEQRLQELSSEWAQGDLSLNLKTFRYCILSLLTIHSLLNVCWLSNDASCCDRCSCEPAQVHSLAWTVYLLTYWSYTHWKCLHLTSSCILCNGPNQIIIATVCGNNDFSLCLICV